MDCSGPEVTVHPRIYVGSWTLQARFRLGAGFMEGVSGSRLWNEPWPSHVV